MSRHARLLAALCVAIVPLTGTALTATASGTASTVSTAPAALAEVTPPTPSAAPAAAATVTRRVGRLERLIADDLTHGRAQDITQVRSGSTITTIPESAARQIRTGATVELTVRRPALGPARGSSRSARAVPQPTYSVRTVRTAGASGLADAQASPLAPHNVVIVPLYWSTDSLPTTAPSTSTLATIASRVSTHYGANTGGATSLTVTQTLPWSKVTLSNPTSCSSVQTGVEKAARDLVTSTLGATAEDRHILAYFPTTSLCGWAGLAYKPGDFIWINGYADTSVWAHEFGHNLGLNHSGSVSCTSSGVKVPLSGTCSTTEYDDPWDIMGNWWTLSTLSGSRQANLGLLGGALPSQTITGTVALAPITATSGTRAVRVPAGTKTYVLEYRTASGLDAWLGGTSGTSPEGRTMPSPGSGVIVRYYDTASGPGAKQHVLDFSSLHPAQPRWRGLQAGEAWVAPDRSVGFRVDSAGAAASVKVDLAPDATPPTAFALTSPAAGAVIKGQNVTISWGAMTDAASGMASVSVEVDGSIVKTLTAGVDTLSAPQTVTLPYGAHKVRVLARDLMGNTRAVGPVAFTLTDDATGPVIAALTAPTAGAVLKNPVPVTWGAGGILDAGTGVASYSLVANGVTVKTVKTALPGTGTTVTLPIGPTSLKVVATDRAGNVSESAPISLRVSGDVTAPAFTLTSPVAPVLTSTSVPVTWGPVTDAGEGVTSLSVILDKVTVQSYTSGIPTGTTVTVAEGRHSLSVVARDVVGNTRTTARTFAVDLTAPSVSTTCTTCGVKLAKGAVSAGSVPVTLAWSATDALAGVGTQSVTRGGSLLPAPAATARLVTSGVTAGTTSWSVTASDKVGWTSAPAVNSSTLALDTLSAAPTAATGYTGAWVASGCSACVGSSEVTTTTIGATYTTSISGRMIGLISSTGPSRGRVGVYVDGVLKGIVSTYSATVKGPQQLWTLAVPAGTHTVKLVNSSATTGPALIGIDAITGLS